MTVASYFLPSASMVTLSAPATTCALDITRFGAITKPVPSRTFWQAVATPRIFTTLGRARATTRLSASEASGASTFWAGVGPIGSKAAGNPEVLSRADIRLGTVRSHSGTYLSTSEITVEPRTAEARPACPDEVSGLPSNQAATTTTTSCRPTPIIESTNRTGELRIDPRTARPSTTPATSPITTRARIRKSAAKSFPRGESTWLMTCGANITPAIAPRITPTKDINDPSAPDRHPEIAAMRATATTAMSSHCELVTAVPYCLRRRVPSRRPTPQRRRCSKVVPIRPHRASLRLRDR